MVSLNEKRSKIRYAVQNKTEWVDDGNKFGKRMLEKMGWQTGVGLGKNEDGRIEHVQLKFKDNLKGVGFINGKYDDTWIEHSQSFDSVLEQLQQSHPTISSSSLHNFNQTVQQTKTRFTYKKQSSGKDLSSRTNNELESIFGRNKSNQIKQQQPDEEKESETISDNLYITSQKSMRDYFKEKSLNKAQRLVQQQTIDNQIDQESNTKKRKLNSDDDDESISTKIIENPFKNSNLNELKGYQGWNIESSFQQIIKKKEKKKKRKRIC